MLKADKGDWAELEQLAKVVILLNSDPSFAPESPPITGEANSEAMSQAVNCSEVDMLWDKSAPIDVRIRQYEAAMNASDARGDLLPFKTREWLSVYDSSHGCLRYPAPPKGFEAAKRYAKLDQFPQHVPVLLLAGDLDTNTSLESGQLAAKLFKKAYFARFKNNQHVIFIANLCGARMAIDFVNTLKVDNPNACLNSGKVPLDIHNFPPLIKDYMAGKPLL